MTLTLTIAASVPEFIQGVSQFSVKGDKESKLRCESLRLRVPLLTLLTSCSRLQDLRHG